MKSWTTNGTRDAYFSPEKRGREPFRNWSWNTISLENRDATRILVRLANVININELALFSDKSTERNP